MEELDLLLNRTTKLVLRGSPGRSAVLEIRRAVNSATHGHGWLTESQAFLDELQMVAIRDYISLLTDPLTVASTPLTGSETGEKTDSEKVSKKGNENSL